MTDSYASDIARVADSPRALSPAQLRKMQSEMWTRHKLAAWQGAPLATLTGDIDVSESDEETLCEALRDFARWIYRQLQAQWDYLHSDESVDENIHANEYEFTAEGRIA